MKTELLDNYVLNILKNSGWQEGRNRDISSWVKILSEEGYSVNDYAKSVLKELGDLQIRTAGDKSHLGVSLQFNPINAASGEYDRMETFHKASKEELFPVGELFDWIVFVGSSKKVYLGDWKSLSIAGNSMEEFLNHIFNPRFQLEEIYVNEE